MFIRETPDGLVIDIERAMGDMEGRRVSSHKRIKKNRETTVAVQSQENEEMMVLRVGNKKFFKLISVEEAPGFSDLIKEDYDRQLLAEKERLAAESKSTVDEFMLYAQNTLDQAQEEINKIQRKLKLSNPMPEINYAHAKAGLSVVKGTEGCLLWLFNTVYNPQFVDQRPLSASIIKKVMTPIIIMITTKEDNVLMVETKTLGLEPFRHYHRNGSDTRRPPSSDCWGQWKHAKQWKTPEDILAIARESSNVLANINSRSLACSSPIGLPRYSTIESHIVARVDAPAEQILNPTQIRSGLDEVVQRRGGWTARTGR